MYGNKSLNNSLYGDYLHFIIIYTTELQINDTTDTQSSASYINFNLHLVTDNGKEGCEDTKTRQDFVILMENFINIYFISTN